MTSLALMAWPTVEAYLKQRDDVLIPVGSIEQHGPNGLIGTDTLVAKAIARGVGLACGACVGPSIPVGMAQHHLDFAGSVTLRPSTLMAVVEDIVLSLARSGFRSFNFINGHGGNNATLEAAFAQLYARSSLEGVGGGIRCRLSNYFDLPEIRTLSRSLYGDAGGTHATVAEIAITMHLYPNNVRPMIFDPEIAPSGYTFQDAASYRKVYPDGRIGSNPALAKIDDGARFLELAINGLTDVHTDFVQAARIEK